MRRLSVLSAALLLCACNESRQFHIELTYGGGITGQIAGVRLAQDGGVRNFRQLPGAAEQVVDEGHLTPQQAQMLATGLQESIGDWTHAENGNMTTTLVHAAHDSVRTWSWSGRDLPTSAPHALRTWLTEFESLTGEAAR